MRVVIELRNDKVEANVKHLCILKGNYLPHNLKNESCKLNFTENKVYENTGERVTFDALKKRDIEEMAKFEKAKELNEQNGLTFDEIAKIVGLPDKASVSRLFKKYNFIPKRNTKKK